MSVEDTYSDQEEDFQNTGEKVVKIVEKNVTSKKDGSKKNKNKQYDVIEAGNFAIIPSVEEKKKRTFVQRSLPNWLAHPTPVNPNISDGSVPISDLHHIMDEDVMSVLKENNISSFFPVQTQVLTEILSNTSKSSWMLGSGDSYPSDICCSAPTGSGKTLAYVIPIVQILKHRTFPAIRCVVMVPVVELATQVYKVFKMFTAKTGVTVGLANGLKSFPVEQAKLVKKGPWGLESKVDVVVCTPGRFLDHVWKTKGFNLTKLRFLVIDEADRMMDDMKHNWMTYLKRAVLEPFIKEDDEYAHKSIINMRHEIMQYRNPDPNDRSTPFDFVPSVEYFSVPRLPLQKLLFSATLSHDPEKLEQLRLYQPKLFTSVADGKKKRKREEGADGDDDKEDAGQDSKRPKNEKAQKNEMLGKYVTPEGLSELFIECPKTDRPMVLLHLLKKYKNILCFTNSVETTHRLCTLMKLMDIKAKEFNSHIDKNLRARIIKQFTNGKIELLISSDATSRGLDLDHVECVLSYDAPHVIKNYIHRVGRTARAGKSGTAITMLEKKEIHHFKKMFRDAGKEKMKEEQMPETELEEFFDKYQEALKKLQSTLEGGK